MSATTIDQWPAASYERWAATCDTLHAHTQVLGKLSAALATPEPELQHAALRLTARGWETGALPAPDGSGVLTVALDLRRHEVLVDHSGGAAERIPLTPHRSVGQVSRAVLAAVDRLGGRVTIDPTPQEVPWTVPLDEDEQHAHYDPQHAATYFVAATRAARVLADFRAPFRGRCTAVDAWWGSFDLGVTLFSGAWVDPPADDFITRNAADAQSVALGWWPGDPRYPRAAFYGFAFPAPEGLADVTLAPARGRFDPDLKEFVLDWDEVRAAADPHAEALRFARSVCRGASALAGWDGELARSLDGVPPPLRPAGPRPVRHVPG